MPTPKKRVDHRVGPVLIDRKPGSQFLELGANVPTLVASTKFRWASAFSELPSPLVTKPGRKFV